MEVAKPESEHVHTRTHPPLARFSNAIRSGRGLGKEEREEEEEEEAKYRRAACALSLSLSLSLSALL